TGGAASPYLLILPFACVGIVGLVPIPPRFSVVSAIAAYLGLLIASPASPPYAHILVLAAGAAAINLAVARHRASIRLFMRIERLSAAVERMRRTQEQLVVVEKLEAMRVLVGGMAHELNNALIALSTAASVVLTMGWGLIARTTGGAASPYLLILPFACVGIVGLVPIPPRFSVVSAIAAYLGLLIASPAAPPYAHILVLAAGAAAINLAVARHRASIRLFMRIERLSAAVERMRRTQEQLVVVEKLEAMRVLVGGMAHELNNALAVSLASNQQAAKTLDLESPAFAAIKRSDGGLTRIRRTVDRIRRFAMSADGILEPADVGAMLDFALESAIGRARSGVIVERTYDAAVGAIECHVAALAEALFQIARNAVEAMPRGGTINASVRAEGDRVILAVADEGEGIPADQLARVFDPFYSRGGAANKSGLGLSAVYGLVSALGGRVEIHSEVGKGTEVAIIMPLRKAMSRPPPPIAPLRG
ncbi:MAG: HAMP domain-containing sensor histidine kinase, partial [Polyangiaceae bacterium]